MMKSHANGADSTSLCCFSPLRRLFCDRGKGKASKDGDAEKWHNVHFELRERRNQEEREARCHWSVFDNRLIVLSRCSLAIGAGRQMMTIYRRIV
jgi:hypothetical protein